MLKKKISSRWEKFLPLYNPLFRIIQIHILARARIARNTTRFSNLNRSKTLTATCFLGSMGTVHSPTWSQSRRTRTQYKKGEFTLSHWCSEVNQACVLGKLRNSSRKEATHSVPATREARTRSCSRSPNLAPNSNASDTPPPTSQADQQEDTKQSPPLDPDIVPFKAEKGHWTLEGIPGQTVLHPSAYVDLQPWDLTYGVEKPGTLFDPDCVLQQWSA